jgi:hypothetical protein
MNWIEKKLSLTHITSGCLKQLPLAHYVCMISINELKHPHIIKTMPKETKILAIDPGMKFMGIAFFEGDNLI